MFGVERAKRGQQQVCSAGLIGILTLFARRHFARSDYSSGVRAQRTRHQDAVSSRSAGNHVPVLGETGAPSSSARSSKSSPSPA